LGKQLYLTAGALSRRNLKPAVEVGASLKEIILVISGNRLGATAVLEAECLVGIITDGDLRRMLEKENIAPSITAGEICTRNPITLDEDVLTVEASSIMQEKNITQLVTTKHNKYSGMLHLRDLTREGL